MKVEHIRSVFQDAIVHMGQMNPDRDPNLQVTLNAYIDKLRINWAEVEAYKI